LLAEVLGTDRLNVYLRFEDLLESGEVERLRELIVRRGRGEPVAYLLGEKEFMGLPFEVGPEVLIPRADTELLVQHVREAIGPEGEARLLDMGSGSGNIVVSILHACPHAAAIAVDQNTAALEVTARNALRHGVDERLTAVESTLFAGLNPAEKGTFDWIVSNPPYICEDEWSDLAVEIREYEPREALLAGADGLDVYRPLVAEAVEWLKPGGRIALEISPRTRDGVVELLQQARYGGVGVHEDLGGYSRLVLAELAV